MKTSSITQREQHEVKMDKGETIMACEQLDESDIQ